MFSRPDMKKLQQNNKKSDENYKGINRRAVSLMPGPNESNDQDIPVNDQTKFRQLLLSIEANKSSCCIKVICPKNKSRAAVLIFRGRAIGCIYGNKRLDRQLFGQEAYACILADVNHQNNTIDAYLLSEELVLAAASLFNGEVYSPKTEQTAEEVFESAHRGLVHASMPGCIVIKQIDGLPVALVYVFGGKIVGVYSHKEGWVTSTYEKAQEYLRSTPQARVSASMLSAGNIDEVYGMSFSLSGIDERKAASNSGRFSSYDLSYAMVPNYDRKKALQMTTLTSSTNPFMSRIKDPTIHNSRSIMNK